VQIGNGRSGPGSSLLCFASFEVTTTPVAVLGFSSGIAAIALGYVGLCSLFDVPPLLFCVADCMSLIDEGYIDGH
jgi:hypothetical protein